MKKLCAVILFILCAFFAGCAFIPHAELPAPTPMPTPTPAPAPVPTPEPTPTPVPIIVPSTVEELSELISVRVLAPAEPLAGMSLTSIGYDGKSEGALKYEGGGGVLLYTFTDGEQQPENYDERIPVSGHAIYVTKDGSGYLTAWWTRGSDTFKLFAEPALSYEDISDAVRAMFTVLRSGEDSEDMDSIEALEKTVGFEAFEPVYVPEGYERVRMYARNGVTPVIIYQRKDVQLHFMKCEGSVYPERLSTVELPRLDDVTVNDVTVNIFSTENGICLAEWLSGGDGYSVSVTDEDGNPIDLKAKAFLPIIKACFS